MESQYDPNKVQRAANVLRNSCPSADGSSPPSSRDIRQIPPSSLEVVFKVDEGPKVKVGDYRHRRQHGFQRSRGPARHEEPEADRNSVLHLLENLFAQELTTRSKLEEDEERIRQFYQEHGYFHGSRGGSRPSKMQRCRRHEAKHIPLIKPNKPGKRADLDVTSKKASCTT